MVHIGTQKVRQGCDKQTPYIVFRPWILAGLGCGSKVGCMSSHGELDKREVERVEETWEGKRITLYEFDYMGKHVV